MVKLWVFKSHSIAYLTLAFLSTRRSQILYTKGIAQLMPVNTQQWAAQLVNQSVLACWMPPKDERLQKLSLFTLATLCCMLHVFFSGVNIVPIACFSTCQLRLLRYLLSSSQTPSATFPLLSIMLTNHAEEPEIAEGLRRLDIGDCHLAPCVSAMRASPAELRKVSLSLLLSVVHKCSLRVEGLHQVSINSQRAESRTSWSLRCTYSSTSHKKPLQTLYREVPDHDMDFFNKIKTYARRTALLIYPWVTEDMLAVGRECPDVDLFALMRFRWKDSLSEACVELMYCGLTVPHHRYIDTFRVCSPL